MGTIFQPEQLCDFVQAEAQPLSGFHEFHPGDIHRPIVAYAAMRAIRLYEQTPALVKADGFDVDAGRLGQRTDG